MKTRPIAMVSVELAVMFAGSTLLTPLYAIYQKTFGFSELTLTLIYAVYVIGNLSALFFLGRLSDQIGRRRTSLPAIASAGVSTILFLSARSPAWLFGARMLSGLSIGLASGTATAWIAELTPGQDKARASATASTANFAGISAGPLVAGLLVQYAAAPLRLSFMVYLLVLAVVAWLIAKTPETVRDPVGRARDISLRPRIGVPREIRAQFVSPAVTVFATFALVGFYAALAPTVLKRDLHVTNVAISGAIVAELFFVGAVAIVVSRKLNSRTAMLGSLGFLLVCLTVLALADAHHSMSLLLFGTAISGAAAAIGYRGSLQFINQIAPVERRAEVISSYLIAGFLGNSLPVIGVGVLSQVFGQSIADVSLAIAIGLLALVALVMGARFIPKSSSEPQRRIWPAPSHAGGRFS